MAALEQFLRSGQLGSVGLGMTPIEVADQLGDPDDQSKKTNPLLLRYGSLHLTFWRRNGESLSRLRQICIQFQDGEVTLPLSLTPSDWLPLSSTTIDEFEGFLRRIDYPPYAKVDGSSSQQYIVLQSGIRVIFADARIKSIESKERQKPESNGSTPADPVSEPTSAQIREMLNQSRQVLSIGAVEAALVMAWAGLEAILRKLARQKHLQSKLGTQSLTLLRELQLTRNLSQQEFEFIDHVRRLRTAIAHGAVPVTVESNTANDFLDLAVKMLERTDAEEVAELSR